MERENKLWYVITCHSKFNSTGNEHSSLIRLVDDLATAKELMNSVYEDAEKGRTGRYGIKYSNPKWIDDYTLQVTSDIQVGWIHNFCTETYHLSDEWNNNIFSNKRWILD